MGSRRRLIRELLGLVTGRRKLFRVDGRSMTPTLDDGDLVFTRRIERAPVGALVVVRHPKTHGVVLVKRVGSRGTDTVSVRSDNPLEGTDSRHFGPIKDANVVGEVTYRWVSG